MQLVHFILPSLATIALGSALLMPHREKNANSARERSDPKTANVDAPPVDAFAELVDACAATHADDLRAEPLPEVSAPVCESDATPAQTQRAARSLPIDDERVVPLTRLRLRSQARSIAWPALIDPKNAAWGQGERAALLRSIDTLASGPVRERVLLDAIGEEDGALRLLALQSLARSRSEGAGDAFAEILVRGSDEERSLAIDALLAIDRREDILAAFGDRVEAIAAKAALAYVGTRRRDDYLEILDRRVDRPRRNAILTLLAATLE
jgi:hypothetical protein